MIFEAVTLLKDELGKYIVENKRTDDPIAREHIRLGNISALENDPEGELKDRLIISVVNLEEESTLKNGRHFQRNPIHQGTEYFNRPVYLNLYLLFSATLADDNKESNYNFALHRLSLILEFFQSKRRFTIQNSPNPDAINILGLDEVRQQEIQLFPELYTLTFEQINHLWGSLGGKQVPSVMYKIRIVKIESRITTEAGLIEEIHETGEVLPPEI